MDSADVIEEIQEPIVSEPNHTAELEALLLKTSEIIERYTVEYKRVTAKLELAEKALQFYSTSWRNDLYVGPSIELLSDSGRIARETLEKVK